ncbi:MAG: hypothetical protein AAB513_01305 [Patescibacteria group bacterium]
MRSTISILLFFLVFPLITNAQVSGQLSVERRVELERQLQDVEKQITDQQKVLEARQKESVSLERDVAILNAKISEAKLSIKARNLSIEKLSDEVKQKTKVIGTLSEKLDRERQSLSQILRKTDEIDNYSVVEMALGNKSISEFFSDIDSFKSVNDALQTSLGAVKDTKGETEEEKENLEGKRNEQTELLHIQELEKKKIEQQEKDKKSILSISKGLEKEYQKVLSEKQKTAAQIRSELFQLQGSAAIPFEKALEYANFASSKTRVRPALILGIIAEESNLGENVGTGNWRIDMHPTRDQPLFAEIMRIMGLNPDTAPVSKRAWYGWGGAMGPAQFIPSTWILYAGFSCDKLQTPPVCNYDANKDRIGKLTGNQPPSPWNPKDAFMASATLMADNGATKGTRASERLAALRYLAGWANATKSAYAFYGNDVMELADKYQGQINILNSSR